MLADMYHMKEPGRWTGWVQIDGERISVDGFHGGRDRTFGVRVADKIDFWLWLDAGFEDRAIEAWIIESADGTVNYVDGGITHADGTLSKRFVKIEHDVEFDGDRKRPARAVLVFTDEDGGTHRVSADAAAPGRQRLLRAADVALPVPGSGQRRLLHPLSLEQQRSRATGRDRGQVDGARSTDALRASTATPAGAYSNC